MWRRGAGQTPGGAGADADQDASSMAFTESEYNNEFAMAATDDEASASEQGLETDVSAEDGDGVGSGDPQAPLTPMDLDGENPPEDDDRTEVMQPDEIGCDVAPAVDPAEQAVLPATPMDIDADVPSHNADIPPHNAEVAEIPTPDSHCRSDDIQPDQSGLNVSSMPQAEWHDATSEELICADEDAELGSADDHQAPYVMEIDSEVAVLPAVLEVKPRCSWLPPLETRLHLHDFQVFRLPDLISLPTQPPVDWTAVALHLANLLKVFEPWKATVEHLDPIITDPEDEDRATEDQLFNWLLSQSEESLRRHLLSLRMVRSPVPFIIDGAVLQDLCSCMPELPLLLSIKLGDLRLGVSKLLNEMWQTNFEENDQECNHTVGYVQIQFTMDYKENGRGFAVADAHGAIDPRVLSALAPQVQAVLLHVDAAGMKEESMALSVAKLCSALHATKPVAIFLRDDSKAKRCKIRDSSLFAGLPAEVLVVAMPNFARTSQKLQEEASDLRKLLMKTEHFGGVLGESRAGGNFSRSSLQALLGNRRTELPEVDAVMEAIDTAPDFVGKLADAHASRCQECKKISMSNVQDDRHTMMRCYEAKKQKTLHLQALCRRAHHAVYQFMRCVSHPDAEAQLQELQKRSAPVNTLFKELYLLVEEKALPGQLADKGPQALAKYIWAGNPFEILDGDNLHLHFGSLSKAFKIVDEWLRRDGLSLYVESTIGPQSSGKSTLNNSKYGCRFNVSEGRCTRGAYGQLVRTSDCALLILDTEGLQSAEKGDPHYDRVMTLLMLATSHRIDVIIKGNMSEPMKRLFEVCMRASLNLEMAKLPSPELHWIFNQVADPNKKHHEDNFRLMEKELAEAFAHDGAWTLEKIQLHKENIDVIPSMYTEDAALLGEDRTWTRLGISTEYARKCREMRRESAARRANMLSQLVADGQEALNLCRWLDLFADVFRTIQAYPDLTHFQDIRHVRLDHEVRMWVDTKLQLTFESEESLEHEKAKMEEWCSCPSPEEAQNLLNDHFTHLSEDLSEMLKKRCRELGCDMQFYSKLDRVLQCKLATRRSSWQTQLQRHFKETEVKSSCVEGHAKIRQRIRELLRLPEVERDALTDEKLDEEFETLFDKIIAGMQGQFKSCDFAYELLTRMHAVSGHQYRLTLQALQAKAHRLLTGPQPDEVDWITRDRDGPALAWRTPPEGASWKHFFLAYFLTAIDPPEVVVEDDDEPMPEFVQLNAIEVEDDRVLVPSSSLWMMSDRLTTKHQRADTRKGHIPANLPLAQLAIAAAPLQPSRGVRLHGKRRPRSAQVPQLEGRKRQRLDPLVAHLRNPTQSLLSDRKVCKEVMKVIKWNVVFRDLENQVSQLVDPSRRPDINLVQLVDQAASNAIDELSKALKAVGCKLTTHGMGELVARALIKAWNLVKDHHFESYMQPIREFRGQKPSQKEFFIASIKQDHQSDKIIASKLAREVAEVTLADLIKEGEQLLKQVIAKNRAKLSRDALQEIADACLGTEDIDAQEENILNPVKVIEQQFDLDFEDVRREAEREVSRCLMEGKVRLTQLSLHADALCRDPGMEPEHTMSEKVFELSGSHSGGPAVTRAAKRWSAAKWLVAAFFTDADQLRQWETPDLWGAGPLTVRVREGKLPQLLEAMEDDTLKDAVRQVAEDSNAFDSGIGCIHKALLEMSRVFTDSEKDIQVKLETRLETQLDGLRLELRSALVPCRASCPCCGRICNNADLGSHHIHRCSSGHQCRGFKGVFLDDGKKTASTRICSEVKDEDKYVDEHGCEWKWGEFKASRPDWDFSDRYDERVQEFQARMHSAWKMVGPRICERFGTCWTEEQTLNNSLPTHFLLVLDSSGSMSGGGWTALHQAVSEMFQVRRQMEGSEADRISAVAFSHTLKRLFLCDKIEQSQAVWNTFAAPPINGRTDFGVAMQGAVSIMKDCAHNVHHRVQLVFMSDGEDNKSPGLHTAINELKEAVADRPFGAFTIGFGSSRSGFGRLREVAEALGGKYVEAVTDIALKHAFVEIAQRMAPQASPETPETPTEP